MISIVAVELGFEIAEDAGGVCWMRVGRGDAGRGAARDPFGSVDFVLPSVAPRLEFGGQRDLPLACRSLLLLLDEAQDEREACQEECKEQGFGHGFGRWCRELGLRKLF